MEKTKKAWKLFRHFFVIGCFTFGGGWSIVAQIQKEYVEKQGILSSQELLDITSVGRSLPGMMIGNTVFLFGYHVGGPLCGVACVLGMALPPMLILMAITCGYTLLRDNDYMMRAMIGVRAAVVPIIGCSILKLQKGAFPYPVCFAIAIVAFGLYLFTNVSCILLVLMGAAAGILTSEIRERKEKKKEHASD